MEDFSQNCDEVYRRRSKTKQLTSNQRRGILEALLQYKKGDKLKRGAINEVATNFEVSRLTVSKIWQLAKKQYSEGQISVDVSSKKKEKCGRKRKDYSENLSKTKTVPLNRRGSIRSLAAAIDVPKSSLFDIFKRGTSLKRISSAVRPYLTEQNKLARLAFCLSMVQPNGYFQDMYNYVHIDEKWFYLTQSKRSYYLTLDEKEPHRSCKSKRFIAKVMFMAAVARPRYDQHKKQYFDGKIGIWPFVYQEPAQRNSKNRSKGTLITKNIESITAKECKKMIVENLIPAIKTKFPESYKHKTIFVQQDNARPHSSDDDEDILTEGSKGGWTIRFKSQPPNSPDFNVLDLGFFNSIQSLQHTASPNSLDELIECVKNAFNELNSEKLDDIFLTLQSCLEATMIAEGSNSYKIPHINKTKLRREGRIKSTLLCSGEAIQSARSLLN